MDALELEATAAAGEPDTRGHAWPAPGSTTGQARANGHLKHALKPDPRYSTIETAGDCNYDRPEGGFWWQGSQGGQGHRMRCPRSDQWDHLEYDEQAGGDCCCSWSRLLLATVYCSLCSLGLFNLFSSVRYSGPCLLTFRRDSVLTALVD